MSEEMLSNWMRGGSQLNTEDLSAYEVSGTMRHSFNHFKQVRNFLAAS